MRASCTSWQEYSPRTVHSYDMICEAISNFDGKIYYDGFVKIMVAK